MGTHGMTLVSQSSHDSTSSCGVEDDEQLLEAGYDSGAFSILRSTLDENLLFSEMQPSLNLNLN